MRVLKAVRSLRTLALAFVLLSGPAAAPALAQATTPAATASQPAATQPAPATAPVTADELQNLVDTIQNPARRQKLVTELQGLIAAQRGVHATSSTHHASLRCCAIR